MLRASMVCFMGRYEFYGKLGLLWGCLLLHIQTNKTLNFVCPGAHIGLAI